MAVFEWLITGEVADIDCYTITDLSIINCNLWQAVMVTNPNKPLTTCAGAHNWELCPRNQFIIDIRAVQGQE